MKKTVLIIEDDENQLKILKQLVLSVNENALVFIAYNEKEAYKILLEKTIDVFLVDIILDTTKPGDTAGIRLVKCIRAIEKYMFTPVIFVTSLEDPTMYCYTDLNCIGYIEKPFDYKRVKKVISRALSYSTIREKEISLSFRKDGILYPIELKRIVYMESVNHIMRIHIKNGSVLEIPYKTCKQVLEEADSDDLIQCSRSTLINKKYVESIDLVNKYIAFTDGFGRVEIGITFKKKIMREFENAR